MGTYTDKVPINSSFPDRFLDPGFDKMEARADKMIDLAIGIIGGSLDFDGGSSGVSQGLASSGTPDFAAYPTSVPIPSFNTNANISPDTLGMAGAAPSVPDVVIAAAAAAPRFTSIVPGFSFPSKPTVTSPDEPGQAPVVSSPSMPVSPDIVLPSVPTLRELHLPDVPDIMIPTFAGASPSGDVPELVSPNFIWQEAEYTERLPELSGKIAQYLMFDYDAAETAIWERGQERVGRATTEAVNGIANDFAARGFSLPTGSMLAAISEARMRGAEARYDNARDAMIKAAELNTQKLTVAIQSGIQYEGMWLNYKTQYFQRAFDAAKTSLDAALKITDTKIALFNSRLQAYQTEAQVHRDMIQAELAKLETYKAQLEGQKLIGDLNMQDVEVYKAMLQGSLAEVELYKQRIAAVIATIDADKTRVEAYVASVQAYKAQIEANASEYGAWAEEMKGEAIKGQIYETEAKAFASLVDAYKSGESVKVERARIQLENNDLKLRQYQATLGQFEANVRKYSAVVNAEAQIHTANVQGFSAEVQARVKEAEIDIDAQRLNLEGYRAKAMLRIEELKQMIAEEQEKVRLAIAKISAAGGIASQLGASAMSAFNLSASTSSSFNASVSNSLSESYSASV
jgi:hypothetical protein